MVRRGEERKGRERRGKERRGKERRGKQGKAAEEFSEGEERRGGVDLKRGEER